MKARKRPLRIRQSVRELQDRYDKGDKAPLENLMKAWAGIKALPTDDPNSFFTLGGYHGEPFRGAGWGNSTYWGGYCNHGNVLFPTWHRVYLFKIEEALQSIEGCEEVMMPYWDETSDESVNKGIPWALTDEFFPRDSKNPNPLRSFVFPVNIQDNINGDNPNYSKPAGYETVRYPLSGLVGTDADRQATEAHNANFPDHQQNVQILNENVKNWLNSHIVIDGKMFPTNVKHKYEQCLHAPNYTVFSNTTSAAEWNSKIVLADNPDSKTSDDPLVVPLESPHNSIHLATGGYDAPGYDRSPIDGANGDMGENDTAGLDPIFFFHHCNVDRMFWLWQKQNGHEDQFDIIPGYPGTNSVDSQGPTPGTAPNSWLTMDSILDPFKKVENGVERPYTSKDCINIEDQLGLTYSKGSLDDDVAYASRSRAMTEVRQKKNNRMVQISNINRAAVNGSFLVTARAMINGESKVIGHEAVLSRWSVAGCANCQTHLEVKATFELPEEAIPKNVQKGRGLDAESPFNVQAQVVTRRNVRDRGQLLKVKLT